MERASMEEKGFTLIELIISLVIVGILAAVAYPSYTRFLSDAKATEAQAIIGVVAAAMKAARQDTTTPSFLEITPLTPAAGTWVDITIDSGNGAGIYLIGTVQVDTGEGDSFRYRITRTVNTFAIRAEGRNGDDDDLVNGDDWLVYSYDAQGNPRATWTAGGSLSAP